MLSRMFKGDGQDIRWDDRGEASSGGRPKSILKRSKNAKKVTFLLSAEEEAKISSLESNGSEDYPFLSSSFDRITNIATKVQRDLDSVQLRLKSSSQKFTDSESDGDSSFEGAVAQEEQRAVDSSQEEVFRLSLSEDSLGAMMIGPVMLSPRNEVPQDTYAPTASATKLDTKMEENQATSKGIQLALSTSIFGASTVDIAACGAPAAVAAVAAPEAVAVAQSELSEQGSKATQIYLSSVDSSYFTPPKIDAGTQTLAPGLTRSVSASALLFSADLGKSSILGSVSLEKDLISNKMGGSFIAGTLTQGTQVSVKSGINAIPTDSDSGDDLSELPDMLMAPPKPRYRPSPAPNPFSAEAMRRVGQALARQQRPLEPKDCGSK
jgi:hypothetical protein